jgi:hypothetical protein
MVVDHSSNGSRLSRKPKTQLANHEVVVVAAYLVGAKLRQVDTEDIAVKANEIAPGRFSWRKYKDQINIDAVRKRLWDATKSERGALLTGSERTGWRLTKAGFDFSRRQLKSSRLAGVTQPRASREERSTQLRELRRLASEPAFLKLSNRASGKVTRTDAERFFRIDDYVVGRSRSEKIERFRIIARNHPDLLSAIDYLASIVRGA